METSRTFSNVLEHFQKKRKNFVANLITNKHIISHPETISIDYEFDLLEKNIFV